MTNKNTKAVLGPGAVGDAENPEATSESTIQPGLVETDEKAGATPSEQAAADSKAAEKAAKTAEKDEKEKN